MSSVQSWRERLYIIIFHTDTPAGRRFDTALLLVILASLAVVMLDSIDGIKGQHASLLAGFEWAFTLVFAIEYILRLYCSPRPLRRPLRRERSPPEIALSSSGSWPSAACCSR